jgi:hypothetical protein
MSEYKKRLLELAESLRVDTECYWLEGGGQVWVGNEGIVDELVMLINKLENYPND